MTDPRELVDAMDLLLARHEQALATAEARRMLEACEGLLSAVERDLPEAADALAAAPARGDARPVLDKRLAETEGLLLQLRLALSAPPPGLEGALRLGALLGALRRSLEALRAALRLWALGEAAAPAPHALLEAARASLRAGAPRAAADALERALLAGLARPLGLAPPRDVDDALRAWRGTGARPRFDVEACVAVAATLRGDARRDLVAAWGALDAVERLVNEAGMTPLDDAARAKAAASPAARPRGEGRED